MALNIGQTIRGRYRTYRLVEALKALTVFKAQVLPDLGNKPVLYVLSLHLFPSSFGKKGILNGGEKALS
jgi:hypothetical protein